MIASMILARGFVHPTAREKRRGSRAEYSCMALNTIDLSHYNESGVETTKEGSTSPVWNSPQVPISVL